ncbi:MAG: hypothetical protein B7733_14940 [Myxococcales bacterium FL481]|nr:MAG: hypothetical protein B7733_14940 [Myxococcales bacterium FL481]
MVSRSLQAAPGMTPPSLPPSASRSWSPTRVGRRSLRFWSRLGLAVGRRMATIVRDDHVYLIALAAIVGVVAGSAAALLLAWIDYSNALFPKADAANWWWWLVVLGVPVLGGLLVGLLRRAAGAWLSGGVLEGVPTVILAVAGQRRLSGREAGVLGIGTGLTIGSGGSVGHEGPSVTIGAAVGSVLGRFFGLRERRQVVMTGAGSAAGLAAAFNAPLSGVIFTVEVIFRRSIGGDVGTMSVFTPLVVAAVAGTFTSHAIFGARQEFDMLGGGVASVAELPAYLVLAVIAGAVSPVMSRAVLAVKSGFDRIQLPAWSKPAIGGLGVGILGGLVFTDLLGSGRHTVTLALHNDLNWQLAGVLIALKIVATSLTLGSGGMGGFFMPSLFIGACMGTVVQAGASLAYGDAVGAVGSYAMVGMGAYLGATLRAPVTSIVMVFELTNEYGLILPVMTASILASFIASRIQPKTLYDLKLAKAGAELRPPRELEVEIMRQGKVSDLMIPAADPVRDDATLQRVKDAAFSRGLKTLHVVDSEARVVGYIDVQRLAERLLKSDASTELTARDLVEPEPPDLLYESDTLAGAMVAFARGDQDVLAVVTADNKLHGYLRHRDLLAYYNDQVLATRQEAIQIAGGGQSPDQEVGLGEGMILDRVVVGRRWAGRTLAELALRRRAAVLVFEWRRGDAVRPVDPNQPLRESDVLAMVGTRESLLKVRWLD